MILNKFNDIIFLYCNCFILFMNIINIHNLAKDLNKEDFISKYLNNKEIDIEFIYESDFINAKILRDFIEIICNKLWFPHKDVSRFILIVDELNNNAIEYWTLKWFQNKLRIKTNWDSESVNINIEVEDSWNWLKHKNALEMETLRAHQLKLWYWNHESIRWRGLFMITVKSVDRLYFKDTESGGLIVWIRKNIEI